MSDLSYGGDWPRTVPFRQKLSRIDWALVALIGLIACAGFAMLYSAAGGSFSPWAARRSLMATLCWRASASDVLPMTRWSSV